MVLHAGCWRLRRLRSVLICLQTLILLNDNNTPNLKNSSILLNDYNTPNLKNSSKMCILWQYASENWFLIISVGVTEEKFLLKRLPVVSDVKKLPQTKDFGAPQRKPPYLMFQRKSLLMKIANHNQWWTPVKYLLGVRP